MKTIDVTSLKHKMDAGSNFILLDVREPYEFDEFNLGGKLIPLGEFMDQIPTLEPHKDEEIIIHCRSGKRSAMAVDVLTAAGFSNVSNLEGGIISWQEHFPS